MLNREAELDRINEALNCCGGDDGEVMCLGCPYFHYARTSEIKCYAYLHRDIKKLLTDMGKPAEPAQDVLTELYQGFLSLSARVTALEARAGGEDLNAKAEKEAEEREKRERFLWGVKVDGD